MLSRELKSRIEEYYQKVKRSNPLFENARRGALGPEQVSRYLTNLLYLLRHTPVHMQLARRQAERRGLPQIARFFQEKLGEEEGHDLWAEADLANLSKRFGIEAGETLAPTMVRMVAFLNESIQREPEHYIAYILLAEYFTVLATAEWLGDLERKCGIPASMLTVLGKHAELDKDHVLDDLREIDGLSRDERWERAVLEFLGNAMGFLEAFCAEVGEVSHAS